MNRGLSESEKLKTLTYRSALDSRREMTHRIYAPVYDGVGQKITTDAGLVFSVEEDGTVYLVAGHSEWDSNKRRWRYSEKATGHWPPKLAGSRALVTV